MSKLNIIKKYVKNDGNIVDQLYYTYINIYNIYNIIHI